MEDNDTEQETQHLNPTADSFRDLLKGDIDIIEYLNSGPGSVGASSENVCDDDVKLSAATRMDINALLMGNASSNMQQHQQQQHEQQQQQQHNGQPPPPPHMAQQNSHHMPMPMLHTTAAGLGRPTGAAPAAVYGQQQHGYHRTSQERPPPYEHHVVRLPDSPPETDSGAGSAGSPSGSETGPYSPEFQQFQRQHLHHAHAHAAALAAAAAAAGGVHPAAQGSVIHPPVIGNGANGLSIPGTSGQIQPPGVILNVHGLDHLTQAVVSDYLPVQSGSRVNAHANGHLTPGGVDYFAVAAVAAGQGGANASVQPPPTPGAGAQQTSPNGPASSASYTPYVLPSLHSSPYASEGHLQRKRTRTDSTAQFVKPEPTSPTTHASEESLFYDENMAGHQAIRFSEFQKEQWHTLCNSNGRELQSLGFAVVADKGFNYSQFDTSFVNQKKNHFQISVHIEVRDPLAPKFVKVPGDGGGLKPISQFQLDFYGVKAEMLSSLVQIKQSQTDRKPIPYEPVTLELPANRVTKVTVARLHFSETTMNNQRKNGRPNPDQKYFYLVAALNAVVQGNEKYTIVAYNSERVIVRASNPGQFDNGDSEVHWQKGQTPNSIFHPGPVGVGTDKPSSALTVTGDISCTGTVYHPSDAKLKQNIQELNCAEALSKLSQIRVVQYEIRPEIAEEWGLKEEERQRVGVIAQEVEAVIPEAVKENGAYLTVDDNRIFYESAAAVKELCRLTGNLEYKVEEVEKISKKLSKLSHLRRLDSIRSTCSNSTCESRPPDSYVSCSSIATNSPALNRKEKTGEKKENGAAGNRSKHRHHHHHYHHHVCRRFSWGDRGVCDNKVIQTTIIVLVAIMAFCLLAMATLYILDWHKRNNAPSPVAVQLVNGNENGQTATTAKGPPLPKHGAGMDNIIMNRPGVARTTTTTQPSAGAGAKPLTILPTPEVHPCIQLPCLEFCCPNSNSYYAIVNKNEPTLEMNQAASNSGVAEVDKPTIVLFSRMMNGPPVGMSFRDKIAEAIPKLMNSKISEDTRRPYGVTGNVIENGAGFGERGKARMEELPKFTIVGLNKTIDGQYCMGEACEDPKRGNFTYYIPVSKYMPHIPLEVKFMVDDKHTMQYCWKSTGDYCYGVEESYYVETSGYSSGRKTRSAKNDVESEVYQRQTDTWELPVGIYQDSTYRFRVGSSSALCSLPTDEVGATFVEYNLHFYRTCN